MDMQAHLLKSQNEKTLRRMETETAGPLAKSLLTEGSGCWFGSLSISLTVDFINSVNPI